MLKLSLLAVVPVAMLAQYAPFQYGYATPSATADCINYSESATQIAQLATQVAQTAAKVAQRTANHAIDPMQVLQECSIVFEMAANLALTTANTCTNRAAQLATATQQTAGELASHARALLNIANTTNNPQKLSFQVTRIALAASKVAQIAAQTTQEIAKTTSGLRATATQTIAQTAQTAAQLAQTAAESVETTRSKYNFGNIENTAFRTDAFGTYQTAKSTPFNTAYNSNTAKPTPFNTAYNWNKAAYNAPNATESEYAPLTNQQINEVQRLVNTTISSNPSLIVNTIASYQNTPSNEHAQALIKARSAEIFADNNQLVLGNPNGDITIVEFNDYNCSYCKQMTSTLNQATQADPNLRVLVKESPVLSPESTVAAKAAIAAMRQGQYANFRQLLTRTNAPTTPEFVAQTAQALGLNPIAFNADISNPSVDRYLAKNIALAKDLGLEATPSIIVSKNNGQYSRVITGAICLSQLQSAIADVRKGYNS